MRCSACFHGSRPPILIQTWPQKRETRHKTPFLPFIEEGPGFPEMVRGLSLSQRTPRRRCWFLVLTPLSTGRPLTPVFTRGECSPRQCSSCHTLVPPVLWHGDSGVALLLSCAWMGHLTRSVYHQVGQCDMCHSRWDTPWLPPPLGTGAGQSGWWLLCRRDHREKGSCLAWEAWGKLSSFAGSYGEAAAT